ncbi:MAG: permease prefix domain 1-containing protein [Gordonia sp. (in: high G+C Gram-positive bacteria)]
MSDVEIQIEQWRGYVERRGAIHQRDATELETHLRDQITDLTTSGLSDDEAFLVAVKRMGSLDAVSHEFARAHSDRLWKQLVLTTEPAKSGGRRLWVMLAFAAAAAIVVKAPDVIAAGRLDSFYARNASLLVLPVLALYFAWNRRMSPWHVVAFVVAPTVLLAVVLNTYPFVPAGSTEVLAAIHVPVVMWFVVGAAYCGGDLGSANRRMDFIRFTGEIIVYYVLLALGSGALIGLTFAGFDAIGVDVESVIVDWIVPFGAAGAVVVAAWLVEAKQSVIENIAPVLTKVFTPLTTILVLALLIATFTVGSLVAVDRDLLILLDVVLVLVLGLLLYAISARDPVEPPTMFDGLQLVLVAAALLADLLMFTVMLTRVAEFGFSPNKVSALGLNLVLAANLSYAGWIGFRFARHRRTFAAVERWQTNYLPMYGGWALLVVLVLPPVFGFA